MPESPTVANSSCLIVLEKTGMLDLLEKLYQAVRVPEAVAKELGSPFPSWVQVSPVQNQALVQSLSLELGKGEAEAIALAQEVAAGRLILDD